MVKPQETEPSGTDRSAETRQRLIEAALDLFGAKGFDGTTTRELALKAKVNLAAIPYHFGGKEKLYRAVAGHIVESIRNRAAQFQIDLSVQGESRLEPDEARQLLHLILERMAEVMTGSESERWARFVLREQSEPTPAFGIIYDGFINPLQGRICALAAAASGRDPKSPELRVQGLALFGQILIFRCARAAVTHRLGADTIGPREIAAIKRILRFNLDAILDAGGMP